MLCSLLYGINGQMQNTQPRRSPCVFRFFFFPKVKWLVKLFHKLHLLVIIASTLVLINDIN